MKWIFSTLAFGAAVVLLVGEKCAAVRLQAELAQCRVDREELDARRGEHARLLALQPTPDELAALQGVIAARRERRRVIEADEREHREAADRGLSLGEWLSQDRVQDRGQSTPAATVQTMLWAAAGGDVTRLGSMLHFDEAARAKLEQIYAALPAATRAMYANPEQLVAAFTAKAIPLGAAQLVWLQESGADEAAACIWVSNPGPASEPATPDVIGPPEKAPPMQRPNFQRSQALLTMRRFDDGWRLIVPVNAIDKLARELGAKSSR